VSRPGEINAWSRIAASRLGKAARGLVGLAGELLHKEGSRGIETKSDLEKTFVEELRPDLFRIKVPLPDSPLKFLNSYVVRSDRRNLVIDTGLNRSVCLAAMKSGLEEAKIDPDRTDFFITHLHADHFGLVSRLKSASSRVFFNRPDAEIIEAWSGWEPMLASAAANGFPEMELRRAIESHPGFRFSSEWVPELNILNDGDLIAAGDYRFQCIHTPGHSLGHTCLYEPEKKLLVAGDHILIDITPNIQCWAEAQNPLQDYLDSLDRVFDLDVELTLPGHRRLIADHRGRIAQLKRHHLGRCDEIQGILADGPLTAYAVASRMRWDIRCERWEDFPIAQKWFATGEAIAHLRYLEAGGQVERAREKQLFIYHADPQPGAKVS
jgi:glyoxylase-like metal-dependent hydrolase (beta-lactamase superfamily II)